MCITHPFVNKKFNMGQLCCLLEGVLYLWLLLLLLVVVVVVVGELVTSGEKDMLYY